jgi:iron complex transport system ATP-binding protein
MIKLNDITLAFGSRKLIEHASAHFECGRMTALLGRNGTGKSTLLRAIASLGALQGGAIEIGGRDLCDLSNAELARMVAFVNTERVSVEAMTAYDLVAVGRSPYTDWSGRLRSGDHEVIERSIRIAGVEHLADRYVDTLSDGECQRVMIAKALAQDTPAILLDEPTSYLDMPNRYELCTLLGRLAHDEGKCVLFSTHELDIALTLSDNIALVDTPQLLYMSTNEMIASGSIERLFDSPYIRFDASTRSIHLK